MTLTPQDFQFFERLLKERSGLALTPDKAYLITTRLRPILDQNDFGSMSQLVEAMRQARSDELANEVVDAMTTNESLFFRDRQPFDALIEMMIPTLRAKRPSGRSLRIWCAAASTGQEPYSIAILLQDNAARLGNLRVEILATDLSKAALKRAKSGEYTTFEVGRGMPKHYLTKYFRKLQRNHYVISPDIRQKVTFQERNLLKAFDGLGRFDIVFCRNVLIYFDRPTKTNVLERIAKLMPDDGYLVLGGPETTLGLTDQFQRHPDWRNVYVRNAECPTEKSAATQRLCA